MNLRAPIRLSILAFAMASIAAAPIAFAQTPPPAAQADQDHKSHQPDSNVQGKQGGTGMMGQGSMMGGKGMMGQDGMMSGDMKQMMSMMQHMMDMMSAHTGTMASHVEGRIATLKAELKITEAQTPQWNRFAEALRGAAKTMNNMHQQMMQADKPATLPARLTRREEMVSAHLGSLKALEEALQPLYAALSDEQKKIADGVSIGPMGMM